MRGIVPLFDELVGVHLVLHCATGETSEYVTHIVSG